MACGRIDERVAVMAWWQAAFGKALSPAQIRSLHPLRRLEADPADGPGRKRKSTPDEVAAFNRVFDSLTAGP